MPGDGSAARWRHRLGLGTLMLSDRAMFGSLPARTALSAQARPTSDGSVDRLIGFGRAPRWCVALLTAVVLVSALLLVTRAQAGAGPAALRVGWRLAIAPALIVFSLLIHPLLLRRRRQAIQALRALDVRSDLVDQDHVLSRLGECTSDAGGCGIRRLDQPHRLAGSAAPPGPMHGG